MKLTIASILPFICAIGFCNSLNAFDKGGQLQLIENRGQVTDQHGNVRHDIDLKAEQGGVTLYVGSGEMHYQWIAEQSQKSKVKSQNREDKSHEVNSIQKFQIINSKSQDGNANGINSNGEHVTSPWERPGEVIIYRMDVELVGANKGAEAVFEAATGYYENYYLAHTGEDGVQARGYGKVTYRNVYPGIDWVIYTSPNPSQGGAKGFEVAQHVTSPLERPGEVLKYDFIVHEGGNVADIRLRYKGATELKMEDGALIATTPFGSITEAVPYSYEAATGREVNSSYQLQGNELSFTTGGYEGSIVIDPVLNWCTYYVGGTSSYLGYSTADTAGNSYLYGNTTQTNIATNGIHQQVFGGQTDMYLTKFNQAGVLQWATYYGGSSHETFGQNGGSLIQSDYAGNIYVSGATNSTNGISTPSTAHQPVLLAGHAPSGFIAKFTTNGQRVWGTYYGDSLSDNINDIDVDSAGNLAVVGYVAAGQQSKLVTPGTYKPTGTQGSYVALFNTNGQRQWGSFTHYYGGNVAIDRQGNVYVGGQLSSAGIDTLGLATAGVHKGQVPNTAGEAYIIKLNNAGQKVWGTFYGGAGVENVLGLYCGDSNHIYIVGTTQSDTGISTPGAYRPNHTTATTDGFIARFNGQGQRVWASYASGVTANAQYYDIAVSRDNNRIIAGGITVGTGNLAGKGAFQVNRTNGSDGFLHGYDSVGNRVWGSYLGGNAATPGGIEYIYNLTIVDSKDLLFASGRTTSTTDLATNGAHQTVFDVNYTGAPFLAQIGLYDTLVHVRNSFADTVICTGDTMHVPYGVTRSFASNNVFRVQLSNSSGSFASPTNIATINGNTAGVAACYLPFSVPAGNSYRIRVTATNPIDTSELNLTDIKIHEGVAGFNTTINKTTLCSNDTLRMSASATTTGVGYAWNGPASFSSGSANVVLPRPAVSASGAYYITVSKGICNVKDTLNVTVNQAPENVAATSNTPVCTGDTLKLSASSSTGGVTYNWSPGGYNTQQVAIPNTTTLHGGVYTVTATLGSCKDSASTTVSIQQSAIINVVSLTATTLCAGDTAQFYGFPNNAGVNPALQWQVNGVDIPGATNPLFVSTALQNGDKVRMNATPNTTCPGTRSSNEIAVTINPMKAPQVTMSASAGPSLYANEPITFTAVATDAGNNPEYQWLRNNQPVGGATGATWGANANFLSDGDDICVRVKSNYQCAAPETATSNCMKLNIRVSVQNIGELNGVKVYPNPVSSQLTIETPLQLSPKGRGYSVVLYDVVGRVVAVPQVTNDNKIVLDMRAVPAGNYVLQVMGDDGSRGYYKIQKGNPQ